MRYDSPEQVFAEFASLSPSYHGLDYKLLEGGGKVWPYSPGSAGVPPALSIAVETPALPGTRVITLISAMKCNG
jgi:predicted molibdopterin-dependent oxidoreductase YjgC